MRPHDLFFLGQLLRNQWRSPQALRELQDEKLQRLVRHAYDRVSYYRRLLDEAGVDPSDVRGVDDLERLPLMSREDLMGLPPQESVARGLEPGRCRQATTSGSTGIPLTIRHRRWDLTRMNLAWGRAYFAHGLKPWQRMVTFSGQKKIPEDRPWYERLGLLRRRTLSTWDDPEQWLELLHAWQPQALSGYVMTLKLLALAIQARPEIGWRPQVVFQSSGLLDEASRRFLQGAFDCKIVDIYGSAEGGCIAWECDVCPGYHVSADMVLVELLRDGRPVPPGEEGEVVITNLHSYAMPFIRYRQGDVGRWAGEGTVCGRGLPVMAVVEGRLGDFITLPSGKQLSPHHFFIALDTAAGVARWRLVQESLARLRVEVVTGGDGGDGQIDHTIRHSLQAIAGEGIEVAVSRVERLAIDPAQKFRSVLSLVDRSSDPGAERVGAGGAG